MNISIIGIGKLGLGFALKLESKKFNVLGVDLSSDYVDKLNQKTFKTEEPYFEKLLNEATNFKATTSLKEALDFSDIIFIIIQTPNSGNSKFYDHSFVSNLLSQINKLKPKNKDIIIGCTVMPKYINTIGKLLISNCENCFLSYNPEFVAQGDIIEGFSNPDIILVGTENDKLEFKMKEIYDRMCDNKPTYCILKPTEAEIVKISINGYITTKLSFANMISDVCDTFNDKNIVDKNIVLKSIGLDTRIGNKYFKPGYSFGGPCFPRDTKALRLFVEQCGIQYKLLEATTDYNEYHIIFQAHQLLKENKDVYVFENICFKEYSKVPIIEESAKLKIAKYLTELNKKVIIKDTEKLVEEVKKEYGNIFEYIIT